MRGALTSKKHNLALIRNAFSVFVYIVLVCPVVVFLKYCHTLH